MATETEEVSTHMQDEHPPASVAMLDGDTPISVRPYCFFGGLMCREVATAICDLVLAREDLFPDVRKRHRIVDLAESLHALPGEESIEDDDGEAYCDYPEDLHRLTAHVLEVCGLYLDDMGMGAKYSDGKWIRDTDFLTADRMAGLWAVCQVLARYTVGYLWVTTDQQHMVPDRVWLWQFHEGQLVERRFVEEGGGCCHDQ